MKDTVRPSVLVIDDSEDIRQTLTALLTRRQFTVYGAGTVQEALQVSHSIAFDLVICDIGLPDGSGFDVIQEIRKNSSVPAIALTAFTSDDDVRACIEAGFSLHLPKPYNVTDFFNKIDGLLRGRFSPEE